MHDVTPAELAVLQVLWSSTSGPLTIRDITDHLYPGGDTAHYATVQKLLERLQKKGCVERNKEKAGRAFAFRAVLGQDDLMGRKLQGVADQLCGGSLTPLITHLVSRKRLAKGEIDELRSMLDDIEKKRRKR